MRRNVYPPATKSNDRDEKKPSSSSSSSSSSQDFRCAIRYYINLHAYESYYKQKSKTDNIDYLSKDDRVLLVLNHVSESLGEHEYRIALIHRRDFQMQIQSPTRHVNVPQSKEVFVKIDIPSSASEPVGTIILQMNPMFYTFATREMKPTDVVLKLNFNGSFKTSKAYHVYKPSSMSFVEFKSMCRRMKEQDSSKQEQ